VHSASLQIPGLHVQLELHVHLHVGVHLHLQTDLHMHVCNPTCVWYGLQTRSGNKSRPLHREETPVHTDHTTTPSAPAHMAEPPFIHRLLIALTLAVLLVAVVSNGAAYLGGVAFAQNVMQLTPITAYVFGGVIELALAVVAGATFIEAYRLQPTAVFRTATWALSGVSGLFGALFEVMEYLTGDLSLSAAASAAGWRMFAPFLAAGLWELVIHLFCGNRHRAHRAQERRHALLYGFFKAGEAEGLAHGTWRAPVAAARARAAARRIAKHVPRDERDAELGSWLASAQYGEHVRVSVAAIAARTAQKMQGDLVAHEPHLQPAVATPDVQPVAVATPVQIASVQTVAPAPAPAPAPARVQPAVASAPVQPAVAPAVATPVQKDVQNYDARVAAAVQREHRAIVADLPPAQTAPAQPRASVSERRDVVRKFLQEHADATGDAVHKALLAAGHDVKLRTAYNDRDAVKAAMA
jgi:hypothetical protein